MMLLQWQSLPVSGFHHFNSFNLKNFEPEPLCSGSFVFKDIYKHIFMHLSVIDFYNNRLFKCYDLNLIYSDVLFKFVTG